MFSNVSTILTVKEMITIVYRTQQDLKGKLKLVIVTVIFKNDQECFSLGSTLDIRLSRVKLQFKYHLTLSSMP